MDITDSTRLTFRMLTAADEQLLFELDQNPEVMRYINGGKISTMEHIRQVFIPRLNSYYNPDKGWGLWGVFIKNTEQFIGWILVRPFNFFNEQPEQQNLELGWRFKQESWGQGLATEAAEHVKQALIHLGGIKQLSAIAMPDNIGSINIMKKIGMRYLRTELHKDPLGDLDVVYYQMDVE